MAINAITLMRKMRGGAQSQLTLCSDGNLWVVKFQNNPQHLRVLANEFIATRLASSLGLTVPETEVINVPYSLVANKADQVFELGEGKRVHYSPGLQFGSRFVGGLMPGKTFDYLPDEQLSRLRNLTEFAGMLAFDKWTGNCDGRQAVFNIRSGERRYRATFIDQGFCFNAGNWDFPDAPLRGTYSQMLVYEGVTGWDSFEPWISRIEAMKPAVLWQIAQSVPPEWYEGNLDNMERLVEQMMSRCSRVRELIISFRKSDQKPFPNWQKMVGSGT